MADASTFSSQDPTATVQRVERNLLWLALDKGVALVNAVVVGALVARYLGPSDFLLLGTALALWMTASNVSEMGRRKVLVRQIENEPNPVAGH